MEYFQVTDPWFKHPQQKTCPWGMFADTRSVDQAVNFMGDPCLSSQQQMTSRKAKLFTR
eukprot:CAMPEP_0194083798 /NCGR_PEP_ID=MMETSP0149-20130528/9769_1 /TAXON_ID=122233 /ORGANISM="Chaetoceros debilis, Strain MM31A-1" /LENGTH=58 /DNA_ID=CAMNT_0038766253 /DNA_START=215 /DNA_END=391 /DNA_ORIENTATION=+